MIAVTSGGGAGDQVELLDLHVALERLAERDPELGELVDMRFIAGLTFAECERIQLLCDDALRR